jgi:hypothetical protein
MGDGAMPTKVTSEKNEPGKPAPVKESRNPTADTRRALTELETGNLIPCADADDVFVKAGIKRGKS